MTNRSPLSVGKKVAFTFITVLLFFATLELACRLLLPATDSSTMAEHRQTIHVLGLPALNGIMEPDDALLWRLKDGLRGRQITGAINGQSIDFRVHTFDSLRSPIVEAPKQRLRILALGDSCTFGLGVDDHVTWPSQLERILRQLGWDVDVINSGVPGFTAWQGRRYLESEGLRLQPDVVVFCFGFNDEDTWASRSDREMAQAIALRSTLEKSGTYGLMSRMYRSVSSAKNVPHQKEKSTDAKRPQTDPRGIHGRTAPDQ